MGEKVTKTVKVPASKAEEWEDYADENEAVDSISHLIRLSVEREMQGKYNEPQRTVDADDGADSGEALTILRKLQTSVGELEDRLSAIERIDKAEASYDLQKATYSFLSEPPDGEVIEVPEPGSSKDSVEQHLRQEEPPDFGATSDEIARKLGANVEDVEETLGDLRTTGEVRSLSGGPENETYWFKRGK